jgi:hypothetical protein
MLCLLNETGERIMPIHLRYFVSSSNKQMKPYILLIFFFVLLGCASEDTSQKPQTQQSLQQLTPSLALFTDTLKKLNIITTAVLDSAVRLYDMLAPHDSTGADSAAASLMGFVQDVVAKQNAKFLYDTAGYSGMLAPAGTDLSDKQKAVSSELHKNKLKLVSDGEGGVDIVPSYETILPTLKARTSAPVDNCLDLVAKEDTTPTFLDAGLAIEITELVDRLAMSEQLLTQKLPQRFHTEAARLNNFYTHALIRGADNTPAIDYNTTTLNEEYEKGYHYLLAKYPSSKAAAKINVWLAVVKSGDRKKIDDYLKLLND